MHDHKITTLGTEPIGRLLLRYSLPAIAGMVVFSLYNIVDSIFIGHGVGPLALSGLTVAFPVMNLNFALGLLFGIGGAASSSLFIGQKNLPAAQQVLGNVLILGILGGFIFGGGMLFFLKDILIHFGASPQTLPYAYDFMVIILMGLPITYTMFNLNHIMRATGYPKKAMYSAVLTVGVNIILAPFFLFVLGWGIKGAALATVLSQFAGMLWVLHHFYQKKSLVHFQPGIFRLKKEIVARITAIGLSPCIMNVSACVIVVLINKGLLVHGGDLAVGAYGVISRVLILFAMIVIGLTQGMQPIVGYNYGAKNMHRVKQTLKYGVLAGVAITTAGFIACEFFPATIAGMFTSDTELQSFAVTGLRLCSIAFILVGAQIVLGNFFQAIGKAKLAIFLSMTRQILFLIPCLLILPHWWGRNGIWISIPISDTLSFIVTVVALMIFLKDMKKKPLDPVLESNHTTKEPLPPLL